MSWIKISNRTQHTRKTLKNRHQVAHLLHRAEAADTATLGVARASHGIPTLSKHIFEKRCPFLTTPYNKWEQRL